MSTKLINQLEALLILENGSISENKICRYLKIDIPKLNQLIEDLNDQFARQKSIIVVRKREQDVEFFILDSFENEFLKHYKQKKGKLKSSALETLSIIAYNQPVTLPEIDDIRGVSSTNQLKLLLSEDLVAPDGKKDTVGNPTLFKTTSHFLDRFKLKSIKDLPELEEIKTYDFLRENGEDNEREKTNKKRTSAKNTTETSEENLGKGE